MRLIEVGAFHESIFQRYCKSCNSQAHRMCHACWVMNMMDELEEAPTINPEDLRPKGQWIERVGLGEWVCSECQHEIYLPFGETPEEVGTNYCPSCGAKMEE